MNYLILMSEMAEKHGVTLYKFENEPWCCSVHPKIVVFKDTPEEAIRAAYLAVNPIEKNTRTGNLSENE